MGMCLCACVINMRACMSAVLGLNICAHSSAYVCVRVLTYDDVRVCACVCVCMCTCVLVFMNAYTCGTHACEISACVHFF